MNTHIHTYGSVYKNEIYDINEIRVTFYPFANFRANIYDLCPFIRKYVIPRNVIEEKYDSFVDFLLNAIKNNWYAFSTINEFFREDVSGDFNHPCYFYGYDMENQIICCADNFGHGKYQNKEVSFDDINQAFDTYKVYNWEAGVTLYEILDYDFKDNINFMRDQIMDYLYPNYDRCYLNRLYCPDRIYRNGSESGEIFFGVDCYDLLERQIQMCISCDVKKGVDIRSIAFLRDHKIMMKHREKYLCKKGIIDIRRVDDELSKNLLESCEMLLHIMLKAKLSCRTEFLYKSLELLRSIHENDTIYMQGLFDELSK